MPPTAAPLLLALALTTAGCAADAPSAADPTVSASAPRPLGADALAALAAERPATGLPPTEQSTEQTLGALKATQPGSPAAVGGVPADQVQAALAFAAEVVAATRADRGYLCGPKVADPAAALGTARYKQFAASTDGARNRIAIEATIGGAGQTDDCGPLTWVGPGVVLGPQTWRPAPTGRS